MLKKNVKKFDPSLINFSFAPIKKEYERKPRRQQTLNTEMKFERGVNVCNKESTQVTAFIRGDLVNVEPKRDLEFYVRQSTQIYRKKKVLVNQKTQLNSIELKFDRGSKYEKKIISPQQEENVAQTQVKKVASTQVKKVAPTQVRESNFLTGYTIYDRDAEQEEDVKPKEKEEDVKESKECNFELYAKLCQLKGNLLLNEIKNENVYADYLIKHLYEHSSNFQEVFQELTWLNNDEYGIALKYLTDNNYEQQHSILIALIEYLNKLNFPKIGQEYLITSLFSKLIKLDIIYPEVMIDFKENIEYKKAIFQTSNWFLNLIEEFDAVDESDDEEY